MGKPTYQKLCAQWEQAWVKAPPKRIGRTMLEKGLAFKAWEAETGGPPAPLQKQLDKLVKDYRRNPKCFDAQSPARLKPGTRLSKTYNGTRHMVTITDEGFEYGGQTYKSLSRIATHITGTRWNGWLFFGLRE